MMPEIAEALKGSVRRPAEARAWSACCSERVVGARWVENTVRNAVALTVLPLALGACSEGPTRSESQRELGRLLECQERHQLEKNDLGPVSRRDRRDGDWRRLVRCQNDAIKEER